jgi:hypothetical protein
MLEVLKPNITSEKLFGRLRILDFLCNLANNNNSIPLFQSALWKQVGGKMILMQQYKVHYGNKLDE